MRVSKEEPLFFKHAIEDTSDLEELLVLLNVSERKKLQVFLHTKPYPSAKTHEHELCLGDVPDELLANLFKN